ncbi:hypothetical protein B9479_007290 [Cryptococcus floricola]|uniref:Amidohydrolase 3 domain-containing protein n=1 Tax=Cryptococcus floricola TaxID=2591691 RepID=A0A5D3AQ05_9TREE|nr:hypothetical protein B9479_007290 [Cryptococcus floricola]
MLPDILFISPTIISGAEDAIPYPADVLISSDTGLIITIAPPFTLSCQLLFERSKARERGDKVQEVKEIEAEGLVLCPGFIDLHAHSDLYVLTHPDHEAKVSQGCTTEVLGQDGISYSPISSPSQLTAIRSQIAAWNGNPNPADYPEVKGLFEWKSTGDYLDCLERNGVSVNVCTLVPQGNLRLLACGPWDKIATADEIEQQGQLLRKSMREGAVGMSSGLTYTPGMYASTSELSTLCTILAQEFPGSFYAPHHRSYGYKALESYGEMLGLAKDTGCAVHLTHATLNFPENTSKAPLLLSLIDSHRSLGCDITLDTYPYLPGCTTLSSLLPSWASAGGPEETMRRLKDEVCREKIRRQVEIEGCDGGHGIPTDWGVIAIGSTSNPALSHLNGRLISEIARSSSLPPIAVFFDILLQDKLGTSCVMHIGNEENVRMIMAHETHCAGSDAILHGEGLHPRAYGTFPRFLGHYSRDLSLIPLPNMIAHLTSRPAKRLSLFPLRGLIAPGSFADIVVFDPKTIKDKSTFEKPKERAEGVKWVVVGGKVVVGDGEVLKGVRGGKVLRRREGGKVW